MESIRIGFVGLGIMGRAMAQNLLKAGFQVTVYNRSKPPVDLLVSAGAASASSSKEVAARSDVVITMVTDSEAVRDVVLGPGGAIEGAHEGLIIIDMSTISPRVTRAVAESLAAKGVSMLDAPVSGGDKGAREGTLTIMVGGEEAAFQRCLPVFQAMGKKVVHMGGPGAGQLAKLSNQILIAGTMAGLCECLLFAKKAGLDLDKLIDSLSAGAASSWALVNLGPKVARRDFAPGFKVRLIRKDLDYVVSTAQDLHVAVPTATLIRELYGLLEEKALGMKGLRRSWLPWSSVLRIPESPVARVGSSYLLSVGSSSNGSPMVRCYERQKTRVGPPWVVLPFLSRLLAAGRSYLWRKWTDGRTSTPPHISSATPAQDRTPCAEESTDPKVEIP